MSVTSAQVSQLERDPKGALMPAPAITSITFDKATYNPGDTITATVAFTSGSSGQSFTFTGTATDSVSGQLGSMTGTFSVAAPDATTVTASDSGKRTWTQKSVSTTSAVFTATA